MSVVEAFKIIAKRDNKRNDFVFQIGHNFPNQGSLKTIGPELKRDALLVANQTGLAATHNFCLLHVSASAINPILRLYLTVRTGQGASRMTYWAVEPNTNLPTFDLLLIPIMISSILLSFA